MEINDLKYLKIVNLNEDYSVETEEFINSFKNLLIKKGFLNEWARLDYKAKSKVLERWWNENINSSKASFPLLKEAMEGREKKEVKYLQINLYFTKNLMI